MAMNPVVVAAPAVAAVDLNDAKAQLVIENAEFDARLTALIEAATLYVENQTGLALITREYHGFLDRWPWDRSARSAQAGEPGFGLVALRSIDLPKPPLQTVTFIKTYDDSDVATTISTADYYVDASGFVGRIVRRTSVSWDAPARTANGIEIQWKAGYGDAKTAIPPNLRHAILLLVSHWFEHTEAVVGVDARDSAKTLPLGVAELIGPHRVFGLG